LIVNLPFDIKHQYFDSDGVKLHYLEAGQGEPIVMMHGFSGTAEKQFGVTGTIGALSTHYRVLAIDGRGHGLSDKPHDPAKYGPEMGRDLLRLLDYAGLEQAHMIGYSLGAMVLAHLICHHPDRFKSCVLGGATGRFNWSDDKQRQLELEASELAQGSKRSQMLRLWPDSIAAPTESYIAERSRVSLEGQDVKALAASRLGGGRLLVTPEQMHAVTVPVMGIVGTEDPYTDDFDELSIVMPQLKVVRIPGANHSNTTARREFANEILRFYASLQGVGQGLSAAD
jgi:pimeloyl-ACP methyl ester carboxylesterase